jgi:hypothetical protein
MARPAEAASAKKPLTVGRKPGRPKGAPGKTPAKIAKPDPTPKRVATASPAAPKLSKDKLRARFKPFMSVCLEHARLIGARHVAKTHDGQRRSRTKRPDIWPHLTGFPRRRCPDDQERKDCDHAENYLNRKYRRKHSVCRRTMRKAVRARYA